MTPEELEILRQEVESIKNSFANFTFKVNKKIGGSGTRESVVQIANGSTLNIGSGDNVLKFDSSGLYSGNALFASAPFRVSTAGALTATSATITGAITATSGAIGGWNINATSIYTGTEDHSGYTANPGDITIYSSGSSASIHANKFYIDTSGVLNATDAVISGSITAGSIDAGSGNTSAHIDTNGNFWVGHADYASAPSKISNAGAATFASATITNSTFNDSTLNFENVFGDGSDGDLSTTGNVALTADTYYNDLTVNNGHTINMAGFRLFVNGVLTVKTGGIVQRTPTTGDVGTNAGAYSAPGTGGSGGGALADGSVKGSVAGEAGANGALGKQSTSIGSDTQNGAAGTAGTAGTNVTKSLVPNDGAAGSNGGAGGNVTVIELNGTGGSAGTGGTAGVKSGTVYNTIKNAMAAYMLFDTIDEDQLKASPSSGSGAAGGTGAVATRSAGAGQITSGASGGAGGGGGNGGIVPIFARSIVVESGGIIRANGGNGGNAGTTGACTSTKPSGDNWACGGSGGSAGGSAGNGGVLILCYTSYTNNGTVEAAAGTAGTGASGQSALVGGVGSGNNGTAGANGAAGKAGIVIELSV